MAYASSSARRERRSFRLGPFVTACVVVMFPAQAAQAFDKAPPRTKTHVVAAETVHMLDATTGTVSAMVSFKVNRQPVPARIVSAGFVPMDKFGNTCGPQLAASVSGPTARFVPPHKQAFELRTVVVARLAEKVTGSYHPVKFIRKVTLANLGAEPVSSGYECTHMSGPPPPSQVCAYGYAGGPASANGQNFCGVPTLETVNTLPLNPAAPFWAARMYRVNNVFYMPPVAMTSGYCWPNQGSLPLHGTWFGGRTNITVQYDCSSGLSFGVATTVYLQDSGPNNENCEADGTITDVAGDVTAFLVPPDVGGWLSVEMVMEVTLETPQGHLFSLQYDWADAQFHLSGTQDGCSLLTTPASR